MIDYKHKKSRAEVDKHIMHEISRIDNPHEAGRMMQLWKEIKSSRMRKVNRTKRG